MTENYLFEKNKTSNNGWIVKLLLFVSFIWASLYTSTTALASELYWSFGNLLDTASENFSSIVFIILIEAFVYWFAFEFIFYLYRYVLQFKIYTFIVPAERLKTESRTFFIYRNVFYGLFLNLCFLFPYLHIFAPLVSLISTFVMLMLYSIHLNKTYAEPIIGHFVFKNFCFPVFLYQAIVIIIDVLGVL